MVTRAAIAIAMCTVLVREYSTVLYILYCRRAAAAGGRADGRCDSVSQFLIEEIRSDRRKEMRGDEWKVKYEQSLNALTVNTSGAEQSRSQVATARAVAAASRRIKAAVYTLLRRGNAALSSVHDNAIQYKVERRVPCHHRAEQSRAKRSKTSRSSPAATAAAAARE